MYSLNYQPVQSRKRYSRLIFAAVVLIFNAACSVFGVESVEEAPYQLVQKDKKFEIRDYTSVVVAETSIKASRKEAGNKAFRKLFAYISGKNEANETISMTAPVLSEPDNEGSVKIAMTAPVTAQADGDTWRYSFVLPQSFSISNAPQPLDPEITLAETSPKRVAILRYAGRATEKAQNKRATELLEWLALQGLVAQSQPRWAGYNAPWTLPPFRRNEVLIDVPSE